MPYTAPDIKDRRAVGDNTYATQTLPDNRTMLTPTPDSVAEPGTDINKALLQPAFDAIAAHDTEIYTNIPQNIIAAINNNSNARIAINVTTANYAGGQAVFSVPFSRFILGGQLIQPDIETTITNRLINFIVIISKASLGGYGYSTMNFISTQGDRTGAGLTFGVDFALTASMSGGYVGHVTAAGFNLTNAATGTLYYMQM